MITTTSYSKKDRFLGLYKGTFRRNIGYFGLITALMLIFHPFQYAMEAFKAIPPERLEQMSFAVDVPFYLYEFYGAGYQFTAVSAIFFTAIVLLAPMILALVLNNYMHSKKAADVYHALPIEREMLLGVNAAVAMSYIAIPVVLSTLAIAVMQIVKFGFYPAVLGYLFLDMAGWMIAAFCIYTVTVLVCVCVGTAFDTFVFSASLLVTAPILSGLFILMASLFLYGFRADNTLLATIMNLSPVTLMPIRFMFSDYMSSPFDNEQLRLLFNSNISLLIWLLLGAGLFLLTMKLYRKRNSETAETTTSQGFLPICIKLIGTIICTVCTGAFFYSIGYRSNEKMAFIMWGLIGGILAYAIIEVILNRGFKTLVKSLPLGVLMVAVSMGSSVGFMTGGLGYENRVPAADKVSSVEIRYMGRYGGYNNIFISTANYDTIVNSTPTSISSQPVRTVNLTDPQNIAAVLDFHTTAVDEKFIRNETALLDAGKSMVYSDIRISYTLSGGGKATRYYGAMTTDTMKKLAPLETNLEFLQQTHGAFFTKGEDVMGWTFSDVFGKNNITQTYAAAESQELLDAICADLSAATLAELSDPSQPPVAVIKFDNRVPKESVDRYVNSAFFVVTDPSQQTYQFLQKKGLLDQLKVDLADCYAVSTDFSYSGSFRHSSSESALIQLTLDRRFFSSDYVTIKEDIENARKYREEHPEEYPVDETYTMSAKDRYGSLLMFEHPADIQAMAAAVAGSYSIGEPLIYANFYFKDAVYGTPVLVPLSRLPEALQKQFPSINPSSK